MTLSEIADAKDTYTWHISECRRMLWTINPDSKEGKKAKEAIKTLFDTLEIWATVEKENQATIDRIKVNNS